MKLLYKVLKLDPESREGIISATSTLGILVNILVALTKVIVGLLASSIAVVSEGLNNAADVLSSVLTLVGTKLAGKHPDKEHPFGYGRIEYLTGLVISVLILVTGIEMMISAVKLIFEPAELSISYFTLIIVAVSAVIKFALGAYTQKMGKKAGSSALEAVGVDSKGDAYASAVTIISALAFLVFHVSIDAYAGVITSALIIKAGLEILKDTIGELIGRPGEHDLAVKIYREVVATEGIEGAADMMLHNYGPDRWSGSVNIEIDHKKSVGEIYQFIHELQLRIMHEYNVVMVFGIYAIDNDNAYIKEVRSNVTEYIRTHEGVKSFHAIYLEQGTDNLYCDLIVEYKLRDWETLEADFKAYMKEKYPEKNVVLTIETEFV